MKKIGLFCLSIVLCLSLSAQSPYKPSEENLKNRTAFQNDKFGIFIHWGIYSMLADGEWILHNKNLNAKEYAKLASGFYPSKFDARAWVEAIKNSGAKYITFTSRHHDGFSMFNTKASDFNIVQSTPFGRDVVKELSEECQKQGVALHFYYSHLDWSRPDYFPLGSTGRSSGREPQGDWNHYLQFMNQQVTELLSNYGPIRAIWFDGWWDKGEQGDWKLDQQYALIHQIQPACMIGNNHHLKPFPGEDFQLFERDLPGENTAGFSAGSEIGALPLETCQTMNGMWGYVISDNNYKSGRTLIQYLVRAAGNNANLLLNIGPQPNGELPATALERLNEMGQWLKTYGETIYGTRGGVVPPHPWGVTTQKDNKLFVHILNLQDQTLFLPLTDRKVKKAFRFANNAPLKFSQDKEGVLIRLEKVPSDIDEVVTLEF